MHFAPAQTLRISECSNPKKHIQTLQFSSLEGTWKLKASFKVRGIDNSESVEYLKYQAN